VSELVSESIGCFGDLHPLSSVVRVYKGSGSLYETGGFIFANEISVIINPSNLRNRSFARLLKRTGIPLDTRFHDLRHTCATLLLSRNVNPKIVSEMLGHSSIDITLNTSGERRPCPRRRPEIRP
jgi:integrase